jgi:hypothetical protein
MARRQVALHQIDPFCAPQLTGAHRCAIAANGGDARACDLLG